ncbi:hypothetical protein WS63_27540 [Burkholderia stagnalis]|uniref:hypothetical protein n=1 Tax=Burkholderia stagnalis TaxID=1503054 RepID=UPI000751D88E|nr:hypothetical protein [Burkholderia stagnalis]KVD83756.1 hypothetical protein WS63_27540 [Burkholderia stagnalis]
MNQRNETLLALDGALAPLLAVVATATDGAVAFYNDGKAIQAQSPFELALKIRCGQPVAIAKREGHVQWGWGFPGWQKHQDALLMSGFSGAAGISDEFLALAGFAREEMARLLALLEGLGHVAFVKHGGLVKEEA